jgi:malonyl CoA-acyl carrier protein transacylase
MASFPDLRPRVCLAQAECRATLSFGSPVGLLTACAVLRDIAFVAVSELATLRGKKALQAPANPTRETGAFARAFSLAGTPVVEARSA